MSKERHDPVSLLRQISKTFSKRHSFLDQLGEVCLPSLSDPKGSLEESPVWDKGLVQAVDALVEIAFLARAIVEPHQENVKEQNLDPNQTRVKEVESMLERLYLEKRLQDFRIQNLQEEIVKLKHNSVELNQNLLALEQENIALREKVDDQVKTILEFSMSSETSEAHLKTSFEKQEIFDVLSESSFLSTLQTSLEEGGDSSFKTEDHLTSTLPFSKLVQLRTENLLPPPEETIPAVEVDQIVVAPNSEQEREGLTAPNDEEKKTLETNILNEVRALRSLAESNNQEFAGQVQNELTTFTSKLSNLESFLEREMQMLSSQLNSVSSKLEEASKQPSTEPLLSESISQIAEKLEALSEEKEKRKRQLKSLGTSLQEVEACLSIQLPEFGDISKYERLQRRIQIILQKIKNQSSEKSHSEAELNTEIVHLRERRDQLYTLCQDAHSLIKYLFLSLFGIARICSKFPGSQELPDVFKEAKSFSDRPAIVEAQERLGEIIQFAERFAPDLVIFLEDRLESLPQN